MRYKYRTKSLLVDLFLWREMLAVHRAVVKWV
jgi:hypothetical protein